MNLGASAASRSQFSKVMKGGEAGVTDGHREPAESRLMLLRQSPLLPSFPEPLVQLSDNELSAGGQSTSFLCECHEASTGPKVQTGHVLSCSSVIDYRPSWGKITLRHA